MNDTNRGVNRLILIVVGLVLIALGAVVGLVLAWPVAAEQWARIVGGAQGWLADQVNATGGAGTVNGAGVIAVAVLLVVAIVLVLCLTRLIGRRSRAVLRSHRGESAIGRITVTEAFASQALQRAFDARDDVLSASVSANDVRRQPVLHVSVTPRRNVSPRTVVDDVDRLTANLAALTGQQIPTFVSLHAGLRSRLAADQSRVS